MAGISLVVFAAALYAQTIGYDYVWDDSLLFLDKTALVNEPLSWSLLSEPVLPGTSYLRPLVFLTMYAEFNLLWQSPVISHTVNVIIFICNVLLVFLVCRRIARDIGSSSPDFRGWLAASLYLVHPAMVESTAWISGRFDLMAAFFMLLGVWIYLCNGRPLLRLSGVSAAMMGALLSKELGAVFPAVLLCIWMARNGRDYSARDAVVQAFRQNASVLLCCALVLVVYILLRRDAMNGMYHMDFDAAYIKTVWFDMLLPLEALKLYLVQSVLPFYDVGPMHPVTYVDAKSMASRVLLAGTFASMLALVVWAFYRRSPSSWLMLVWLGCLTPVLHLVPITIGSNLGHERFLTVPLAFFVMAVVLVPYGTAFGDIGKRVARLAVPVFSVAWVLLALITTLSSMSLWANELRLWHWAYTHYPKAEEVRYNYLYGALKTGRPDIVEKEVAGWIEAGDGLEVGEQILYANLLIRQGDPEGKKYLEGLLYALPDFHDQHESFDQIIGKFYLSGMQIAGVYVDYANALLVFEGNAEEALKYNQIASWYLKESEDIPVKYQRAAIYFALDRFDEASAIMDELEPLYYYRKVEIKNSVVQLLSHFCRVNQYQTDSCQKAVARGMVSASE